MKEFMEKEKQEQERLVKSIQKDKKQIAAEIDKKQKEAKQSPQMAEWHTRGAPSNCHGSIEKP